MISGAPPLSKRRRRVRQSPSCVARRAGRLAPILRRLKFPGSRFPVRATCGTQVRRRVGAQDAGQGRSRPQARRCCSGPRCLLRFSRLKEARPEREATSRSRPSSRSWGLRNCRRRFMLTRHLPPTRSSAASEPSPNDLAAPMAVGPPPAAPAPPVVAVNKIADSGPGVSQSLRTMSALPEATAAPSATRASEAAPPDAPQRPAEAAPTVESKVVTGAQPLTPNLVRPTKLSRKTPVRVMVAKTAATTPSATAEIRRQPQRPGASTIPPAPAAPQTTAASATGQESRQSSDTCLWHSSRRARGTDGRSDRLQIGRLGDSVRRAKIGGGSQGGRRAAQRQIRAGAQRRDDRRS